MKKRLARAFILSGILAFGRSMYELDHIVISGEQKRKCRVWRQNR